MRLGVIRTLMRVISRYDIPTVALLITVLIVSLIPLPYTPTEPSQLTGTLQDTLLTKSPYLPSSTFRLECGARGKLQKADCQRAPRVG